MIEKIVCDTFFSKIYMGLRKGYNGGKNKKEDVLSYLSFFTTRNNYSLSVTDVDFLYSGKEEKGICIKITKIPHYNIKNEDIIKMSEGIVEDLLEIFEQEKIIVVYPDKTITFKVNNG